MSKRDGIMKEAAIAVESSRDIQTSFLACLGFLCVCVLFALQHNKSMTLLCSVVALAVHLHCCWPGLVVIWRNREDL